MTGVQEAVYLASSFLLGNGSEGGSGAWEEGLQLPNATQGSGMLNLTLGACLGILIH